MAGSEAIIGDKLRGHDTRFVSASWALFYEAPMLDIQGAAFWANLNSFIFCYLKDVLIGEVILAKFVLKASSAGAR